jgi:glycosyltransferase involved in cell wall biosynthesis
VGAQGRKIDFIRFADNHLVIEARSKLFKLPSFLFPLNFIASQFVLLLLLSRIIRTRNISAIVSADPFYTGLMALLLKWIHRKPLIIRLGAQYDDIYEATGAVAMPRLIPSYRIQTKIAGFVLKRADLVGGNNRNNLGYGITHGARKRTAIMPISGNIAAIHQVPPSERVGSDETLDTLGIPKGVPLLLYVGRLLKLKHADDALRAMAYVIKRRPKAVGLLAGTGELLDELKALARELGVEGSIRFLGQVDQRSLSLIAPHAITISPHTGLSLIECALGGSPIVAYNRDWQPEFIEDNVNGFIVPFLDHETMGKRALQILEDPELRQRLSVAIRARGLRQIDADEVRRLEWTALQGIVD